MKIMNRNHSRKAISPVLATVILIAITLVAAVAIATFVFGVFSSSITGPQLSINSSSVVCVNGGTTAGYGYCLLTIHNAGGTSGQVLSVGPTSTFSYLEPSSALAYATCKLYASGAFTGAGVAVTVAPNSNVNVCIEYQASGVVEGYLVQGNGPNIAFTTSVS